MNSHIGRSALRLSIVEIGAYVFLGQHELFKCIRDEVDDLHAEKQSRGFFRVAYVGGKKPPKDLGDADGICEWLDERKVIDMQWQKIKNMMESARHLELVSKEKDDD
jgi:hypothetical protein